MKNLKIDYKKLTIATILMWLAGTIIVFLTCGWLFKWVYEIPPLIWLAPEQMMSAGNMLWSNLIGILRVLLFALVFIIVYDSIPYKGWKKGMKYGFIIWLVSALSGMISMPLFMTISWTVVIYWIAQALVTNLVIGAILGAVYKK